MSLLDALRAAGGTWLGWMGPMTWQVAVLAVVLLGITVLLRKAPASLRNSLWLLVFVKLVLHPGLSTPWSPGNLMLALPVRFEMMGLERSSPSEVLPQNAPAPAAHANREAVSPPALGNVSGDPAGTQAATITLMGFWAAGAAILMLLVAGQTMAYSRRLMRHLAPAPDHIMRIFRRQQEALKTHRGALYLCDVITTPGVFGAWRPKILLPRTLADATDEHALSCVLAHELAHIKRFDLMVSWAATLLTCVYWFHPAVWLANLKMRREREMACDDAALLATGREGREYAGTILRIAEGFSERVPAGVGLLGLLEMSDNLLQRVRSAGDSQRARKTTWRSAVILAVVVLLLPMGAWHGFAAPDTAPLATPKAAASSDTVSGTPVPAGANPIPAVTPAPAIPGVAFLEIGRVGASPELAEAAATLYELITDRLINAALVRLVERDKVEKAAKELALDASGLVRADTAAQLGKLVGARTLITSKLMRIEPRWVLTARLIDSETSELSAVRIECPESDGLQRMAELAGDGIAEKLAVFCARETATSDPQQGALAALQERLSGKELPRVVVCIPESHIGTWVPDPAGENAVCSVLAQTGFRVVDVSTFMKREPSSWWLNIFHGPARDREGTDISIRQGFRSVSDILHDTRLDRVKENADIFIIGEAFSEYAGDNYGFKSCRARIEIKAIDTKTEQIAAALSQHATAADTAELLAGKTALRSAGSQIGLDLAKQLSAYWEAIPEIRKAAS